jgi:hypothetical protein
MKKTDDQSIVKDDSFRAYSGQLQTAMPFLVQSCKLRTTGGNVQIYVPESDNISEDELRDASQRIFEPDEETFSVYPIYPNCALC